MLFRSIHAKRTGNVLPDDVENNDIQHLEQQFCKLIFSDGSSFSSARSRVTLFQQAMKAIGLANYSSANAMVIRMWWWLLKVLPLEYARMVFAWKMLPSSRPLWLKKVARIIRRV